MIEDDNLPPVLPLKRPRGRPRTGQTPPTERKRKQIEQLQRSGGRILNIALDARHVGYLERIRAEGHANDTEAIKAALRQHALRRSRKPAED